MWKVIIQCSADSWKNSATEFKAIAAQYPLTLGSSKKMKGDEQRIMEYENNHSHMQADINFSGVR